jgi:hypothetical protein
LISGQFPASWIAGRFSASGRAHQDGAALTAHVPVGPLCGRFFSELQWALCRLDYMVVQYGCLGFDGDEAARARAEGWLKSSTVSHGPPGPDPAGRRAGRAARV